MSHFDTETIILRKKKPVQSNSQKVVTTKKANGSNTGYNTASGKKIRDEDELPKQNFVGKDIGMKIQQARNAKGWKQKVVAGKLGIQPNDFAKLENGTAIRNGQQLNKLGLILGVKLTGKGV